MTYPRNSIILGDCTTAMQSIETGSVDFILTDPPYLVEYRERAGRKIDNDDNADWLEPSAAEMYRVLKDNAFCVSFYGWTKVDLFMAAWRKAGFRPVSHIVFRKSYTSRSGYMRGMHESAFLLAKGRPPKPAHPIGDIIDYPATDNRLHPTQKPVAALKPLVECFTNPGELVLDPFCGSGSSLVAAQALGRDYIGIDVNPRCHEMADRRLTTLSNRKRSV